MKAWLARAGEPGWTGLALGAVAAILSGVAWTLGAPPYALWPMGWIAALPLAWAIDRAPTARRAGWLGALAAATFTVGGFPWMVYLLRVNAHLPTPVAVLGLLLLAAYHGVVFLVGARLTRSLRDRRRGDERGPLPMALCLPLGFVVVEVVLPTPFPFSLALTQTDLDPVRRLAAFAGTPGIVALITAAAGAAYDALTRERRRWVPAAGVAAFALVLAVGSIRIDGEGTARTMKIGVVQPNQPVDEPEDDVVAHLRELRAASVALERAGADLVVWSEAAYPLPIARDLDRDLDRRHPLSIRGELGVPLLVGAITTDRKHRWNSAILVAPDGWFLGRTDKINRMIGSEYNPLVEWFPSLERYMPDGAGHYAAGGAPEIFTMDLGGRPVRIAVMVCLEDVVPRFGRELARLDPDLVVNVTNDTWFDIHAEPYEHEALARYRTVEMGVPMIRAVNTGPSSHVDRDGRVVVRTPVRRRGAPETMMATVTVGVRARSLYAVIGGWLTWGVAIGSIAWWIAPGLRDRVRARVKRRRGG